MPPLHTLSPDALYQDLALVMATFAASRHTEVAQNVASFYFFIIHPVASRLSLTQKIQNNGKRWISFFSQDLCRRLLQDLCW